MPATDAGLAFPIEAAGMSSHHAGDHVCDRFVIRGGIIERMWTQFIDLKSEEKQTRAESGNPLGCMAQREPLDQGGTTNHTAEREKRLVKFPEGNHCSILR